MLPQRIAALALCSLIGSGAAAAHSAEAVKTAAAETTVTAPEASSSAAENAAAGTTDKASEPAAAAAAEPTAQEAKPAAPPPPPTLTVSINLATQNMTVSENGSVKYSWPISSGTAEFPTPRGTFRPQWSAKMWYSRKYDMAPMPHAVFIHGGVAVHGTQHLSRLGSPASHGCIRLAPGNARTFYNLVHSHGLKLTRVSIHGTPNYRAPAVASRKQKPVQYAQQDSGDWWFSGPSYYKPAPASAYNPNFVKKQKLSQAQMRAYAQGKKVAYRMSNGQIVYLQRPPKVAKYGGYSSGW